MRERAPSDPSFMSIERCPRKGDAWLKGSRGRTQIFIGSIQALESGLDRVKQAIGHWKVGQGACPRDTGRARHGPCQLKIKKKALKPQQNSLPIPKLFPTYSLLVSFEFRLDLSLLTDFPVSPRRWMNRNHEAPGARSRQPQLSRCKARALRRLVLKNRVTIWGRTSGKTPARYGSACTVMVDMAPSPIQKTLVERIG
jgi:hypothetical protein